MSLLVGVWYGIKRGEMIIPVVNPFVWFHFEVEGIVKEVNN